MKLKLLVVPSAFFSGATTTSGSVALNFLIRSSIDFWVARPWWQFMQTASGPRLLTVTPLPKVTLVKAKSAVTLLWQALQVTVSPTGTALSTLPTAEPSPPRKSMYPVVLWHSAQMVGTSFGSSSFQCVKASDLASLCGDATQVSMLGAAAAGLAVGAGVGAAGQAGAVGQAGGGAEVGTGVFCWQAEITNATARKTPSNSKTFVAFLIIFAFSSIELCMEMQET